MERQLKRSVAKLPVVCFYGRDELTINGFMVNANALSGEEVDLTSEDKKKLEYSLRVFKGLAASAANSVRLVEFPHKRKTKRR